MRRRRLGGSACTKIFVTGIGTHQRNADSTHADGVVIGKWGKLVGAVGKSRATVPGRFIIRNESTRCRHAELAKLKS